MMYEFNINFSNLLFLINLYFSSSPDSLTTDRSDKSSGSASQVALYKLVIPLLRCEVTDIRDAAVNALGLINHDALKYY